MQQTTSQEYQHLKIKKKMIIIMTTLQHLRFLQHINTTTVVQIQKQSWH